MEKPYHVPVVPFRWLEKEKKEERERETERQRDRDRDRERERERETERKTFFSGTRNGCGADSGFPCEQRN